MSRTGTSTPEVTNAEAAAASSVSSLRRASARFRGAADSLTTCHSTGLGKRNHVPYVGERNKVPFDPGCQTNGGTAMPHTPRFGIMTAPAQVDYHDILRVW